MEHQAGFRIYDMIFLRVLVLESKRPYFLVLALESKTKTG